MKELIHISTHNYSDSMLGNWPDLYGFEWISEYGCFWISMSLIRIFGFCLVSHFFFHFIIVSFQKTRSRTNASATYPEDGGGVTTVRRNYQMAYIPSGFWSRLITRLIVSVQRWRAIEHINEESYSLVYWREGIGVVYEGGHFQVESYQELVKYSLLLHRCLECRKIYVFSFVFFVWLLLFLFLFICLLVFLVFWAIRG